MAKWARKNDEGQIVEVIDFDPTDKFHASIVWEKVPDNTEPNNINNLDADSNPDTLAARAAHQALIDALKAEKTEE